MMFPKNGRTKKVLKRSAKVPERVIQKQCEAYLLLNNATTIRIPDALYRSIFANYSIPVHIKKQISDNIKGVPDLVVLGEGGKFVCFELKSETGKQTQAQKRFERGIKGHYHIVRSFGEFRRIYDNFRLDLENGI